METIEMEKIESEFAKMRGNFDRAISEYQDAYGILVRKNDHYDRMLSTYQGNTVEDRRAALLATEDGRDIVRLLRAADLDFNVTRYNIWLVGMDLEFFIAKIRLMAVG
jgi:hypothetical protein